MEEEEEESFSRKSVHIFSSFFPLHFGPTRLGMKRGGDFLLKYVDALRV